MAAISEQEEFEFRLRAELEAQQDTPQPETMAERSAKYGSITRTPTAMEKIGNNLTSPKTKPLGLLGPAGLGLSAFGVPEEDVLPMAGQIAGTPAGFLGATGGAMAGQGIKQIVQPLRGKSVDVKEVGKEGLITGLIEGLTRGTGKLLFKRQMVNETKNVLGRKLGEMKATMSKNPKDVIDSIDIYVPLKESFEKVAVPHGPQATLINKWLRFMEKNPKLTSRNLIEMEKDLGEVAKYGEFEKGALQMPVVKKPALNSIAKDTRRQVSDVVDNEAEQQGLTGFGETSKKLARILQDPDSYDVTKSTAGGFLSRVLASAAAGGVTQNVPVAAATYLGMQALQSPEARNMAFKAVRNPVVRATGTATKLTMSELARRKTQK